jgi:3'-5' exoribonuclease
MPPIAINELTPGARVQHELLVVDRAEKKTSGGDPFVVLTLGNATGRIETAPIWSNQIDWAAGAHTGKVVQAVGEVTLFGRGGVAKRQLSLSGPVRVLPDDAFNIEQFLPGVGDPTRLWDYLDKERAEISSGSLRGLLDLFFADDDFRVQFERAPASVNGHHAKVGGLLLHVSEVVRIAKHTARTMRAHADLVAAAAMLHDVGKVEAYSVGPGGFAATPSGLLIGHVVLGCLMLERRLAASAQPVCSPSQLTEVQHMILSHHGSLEFGSPVRPMTTEAEILHWADEASAKATDMHDCLEDPELFASGGECSDRGHWRLGRRIWRRPHRWE